MGDCVCLFLLLLKSTDLFEIHGIHEEFLWSHGDETPENLNSYFYQVILNDGDDIVHRVRYPWVPEDE